MSARLLRQRAVTKSTAKTAARGYGAKHQTKRRICARRIASGEVVACARCGRPILPGTPWDLGHVDGTGRREYSGPEHRGCNRATETHGVKQRQPWTKPARKRQQPSRGPLREPKSSTLHWSRVWSWPIPDNVVIDPEVVREYQDRGV